MARLLTGIQPSGAVHIGNYLGMIKEAIALSNKHESFLMLADLHCLTSIKDGSLLKNLILDCAATWIACGLDINKHTLFLQSEVGLHPECAWCLSCVTGMGLLEKGHSYKDAIAGGAEVNHGRFSYPVLMAADILLYDADLVPVGKDQKQHVEFARDMAGSFNAVYGKDLLKLPEPYINEDTMTVPGLDGRKMSKSYGNVVPMFESEATLKKLILSIKTDSSDLAAPKELDGSLVGTYFKLFATPAQYDDLKMRLAKGGLGWGHAKTELFELINTFITPFRDSYNEVRKDEKYLLQTLHRGSLKAFNTALPTLQRMRKAVGLTPSPMCYLSCATRA